MFQVDANNAVIRVIARTINPALTGYVSATERNVLVATANDMNQIRLVVSVLMAFLKF